MTKHKIIPGSRASIEFTGILMGGGSPYVHCGFCGREHYALDSIYLFDGEPEDEVIRRTENIINLAKENPDTYIIHRDTDSVSYSTVDTQTIVDDCPCNGLRRYEDFFWNNRDIWKSYMMHRKLRCQKEIDDIGSIENYNI